MTEDQNVQLMAPAPRLPDPRQPTPLTVAAARPDAAIVERQDAEPRTARLRRDATWVHEAYLDIACDSQCRFFRMWSSDTSPEAPPMRTPGPEQREAPAAAVRHRSTVSLSLETAPWLGDHRPLHIVPVVPLTGLADMLAQTALLSAPNARVTALHDVHVHRWVMVTREPTTLVRVAEQRTPSTFDVRLLSWRDAAPVALSRFEAVASARVDVGDAFTPAPPPLAPLIGGAPTDPYRDGLLFHGPAFQLVRDLVTGHNGASAVLDAGASAMPCGVLHPALVDAMLHSLVHFVNARQLQQACVPIQIPWLRLHGPTPTRGEVRCEVRPVDHPERDRVLTFELQGSHDRRVWMSAQVVMVLRDMGRFGAIGPQKTRAFVRDRRYLAEALLSVTENGRTILHRHDVTSVSMLPESLQDLYRLHFPADAHTQVAIKEHAARLAEVHPCLIDLDGDLRACTFPDGTRLAVLVEATPETVSVTTNRDSS